MSAEDSSHDSGSGIFRGRVASERFAVWWDPRRSLGARLALVLLPLLLVPVLFYWYSSSLLWRNAREEVAETIVRDAIARERGNLKHAADRRGAELEEESQVVVGMARSAAAGVRHALEEGPLPGGERIEDVPGGPIRAAGRGASAAMISRAVGVTPLAMRDLAATRRLEPTLGALASGHPSISSVFVVTASGVLRAFPWSDLGALVAAGGIPADFRFPGPTPLDPSGGPSWTGVYDDHYAGRGRIVTAFLPVRDASGNLVAEVGVDWAPRELFTRLPEARRRGERDVVFAHDGRLLLQEPQRAGAIAPTELLAVAAGGPGEREAAIGGESFLASVRVLRTSGWTYVRLFPLSALRDAATSELDSVFAATRVTRERLQLATLILLLLMGGPLIAVARRATAPVRGLARYSEAITRREDPGPPPGAERHDEVGRLARALEDLDGRVRRRLHSMEGLHDLARTGAMMTRPDETYARLTRKIAELVGARKAWFALWDAEGRELIFTPPGYGIASDRLEGIHIPGAQHSLATLAFRTGETYVSNDLLSDPRASQRIARELEVTTNAVFVPLRTEAGTLGVLIVCDKPEPFDHEDQAAIQIYADEAALLLRNARLYEELQKSFERLRDAHRGRDYFLQNINHELRTPLTAILGWSEVLAEDHPDPPTVATAVEQIRRSAQFLLTLISDLLDLSRFEEGRTQIDRAPSDVGVLVREAIEPVVVMAEAKGIAIGVMAPQSGTAIARLDPLRTRQVLWNLVHNAVKFTHKGGHIDVGASRDDMGVTFTVADDGVGIDPKDLPFIFERFRQGDGSTTRAYRGTGIGLALAKAYVELHGGRIEAENRPGCGALFRVFIPDPVKDPSGSLPRPAFRT